MQIVDARGLSCPEPAMMAIDAMDEFPNETIQVLVSVDFAKVNVMEAAQKKGRKAEAAKDGRDFVITIE